MSIRTAFIDLVHVIGALGCLVLTGGFAAGGQFARSGFYGVVTMLFVLGLVHRQHRRQLAATPRVIDLREGRPATAVSAPAPGRGSTRR